MSEKTFGTWLLEQQGRQDTTGTLARAWQQLRDSRGYKRHTKAESIRELMSGALGEDWQALRGDDSIAAAVKEWQGAESEQLAIPVGSDQIEAYYGDQAPEGYQAIGTMLPGGSIQFDVEQTATGRLVQTPDPVPQSVPMAVLWVGDSRFMLMPGETYTLSLEPELRRGDVNKAARDQAAGHIEQANDGVLPDGRLDWAVLYSKADHGAREGEWPE